MSFEAKIIVADFRTSLAGKIAVGGETGSIQNNLDDDGVALPTGKYYFTLDSESSQKEHITCTLTGKNMTNIKSVSRQGVETTGVVREHRVGATITITDFAHIKDIADFVDQYDGKWMGAVADYAALLGFDGGPGIAHWNFDGNANDVSGNGYNGTVVGATLTTDRNGNPDSAYYFDGTETNYIEIGTVALNPFVGSSVHASVSFWMYGEAGGVSEQVIISLGNTARWYVKTNTGRIYLITRNSTNTGYNKYYSNTIISNGEWHHISVVVDGTDLTFYIDGVAEATQTIDYYNQSMNYYIIASGDQPSTYHRQFKGKLDDIRVHAVALTASQVSNIYKGLPNDGEVRVTLDDSAIYVYNDATSAWIKQTPGSVTVYLTNLLGTESTGDDNKTFTLASGSFSDKKYLQVWLNGVLQKEGATFDYVATGSNQAVFNDVVADEDQITLRVQE